LIERSDRDLADQLRRAASSVVLNLAEGQRSAKGNRHKHYAIAHGSANEVKAGLRLAVALRLVEPEAAERALKVLDRQLRLLWKLTHPSGQPRTKPFELWRE
jgi:four helix bundle protein